MHKLVLPAFLVALTSLNGCGPTNKTEQKATDSIAVANGDTTAMIDAKLPDPASFAGDVNGKKASLFILKNDRVQVAITNYGAPDCGVVGARQNRKTDRRCAGLCQRCQLPESQ